MTQSDKNADDLKAAEGLRQQIQERFARKELATTLSKAEIPEFMAKHIDMFRKVAESLGHTTETAGQFLDQLQHSLVNTELPGPFDEPTFHAVMDERCNNIESACKKLGLPLRSGVAYGVNATVGLEVSQRSVLSTDASIISVSKMFIPFCGIVSKALARSLPHIPRDDGTATVSVDVERVFGQINADRALREYWFSVVASFAFFGSPAGVKPDVIPWPISVTRGQLLEAMEIFAIAHEYGHHIAHHGVAQTACVRSSFSESGYAQEFQADFLACVISSEVSHAQAAPHPYLLWGTGGVIVLKGLDLVRRARHVLNFGDEKFPLSQSHPPLEDRLKALEYFNSTAPEREGKVSAQLRQSFTDILDRLWRGLYPLFTIWHADGIRPVNQDDAVGTWLLD
jgi:hypothetical protein